MRTNTSTLTDFNDNISDRYRVIFIIFVALGIYYPSIFGVINSVDDADMVNNLMNMESINWDGLFLPGASLKYYRPVLYFTFILDRFLWLCEASFMHLENILFHAINGILIFFMTESLIERFNIKTGPYTSLFVSLLFLITPLNTEAVNWISGRTDLMAGTFVFLSLLIFLKKGLDSYFWCWVSSAVYLLGLLSKEVAIALLPVIVLFLFIRTDGSEIRWGRRLKLILPFLSVTIFYIVIRLNATGFSDAGLLTLSEATKESRHLIKLGGAIKAFGFYMKKLFIPLPLNFAIVEINRPLYFWFGSVMILLSLLIIKKRGVFAFFFLLSILFFLPAIPVAISKMAWTPLAERYLYISSFGASFIIVYAFERLPLKKGISLGLLSALLIVFAIMTVQRNYIWQDNLSLFEDTVKKSPRFAAARNEYGIALAKKGRLDEAREQFVMAQRLGGEKYWIPALNIIEHEKVEDRAIAEAKKAYIELLSRPDIPKGAILKRIIALIEAEIMKEKDAYKVSLLLKEEVKYLEQLTSISRDGSYFYRLGQLYLKEGKKDRAKECFDRAVKLNPDAYFASAAKKLSEKIRIGKI